MLQMNQPTGNLRRVKTSAPPVISVAGSTWRVEHLNTFTCPPEASLPTVREVVYKIFKSPPTNVTEYTLTIEKKGFGHVLCIKEPDDHEDVGETMPMFAINDPTCYSSGGAGDQTNLILFRVYAKSITPTEPEDNELHVFRVLDAEAKRVVDTFIKAGATVEHSHLRQSQSRLVQKSTMLRRETSRRAYNWASGILPKSHTTRSATRPGFGQGSVRSGGRGGTKGISPDEINTDYIIEEVKLLNYAFDHIEETLQFLRDKPKKNVGKAAVIAAYASGSTRSQSSISKTKFEKIEKEVNTKTNERIERLFNLFKFCAIILSRISDYVKEPEAPVLLKKLFRILAEAVERCRHPKTKIAHEAVAAKYPTFPRETLEYMHMHLTPNAQQILDELGIYWNTSREDLRDNTVYIPDFEDKYKINIEKFDPTLFRHSDLTLDIDPKSRYVQVANLSEFAQKLLKEKIDVVKAILNYKAKNERELTVEKNEYLELIDGSRNWYHLRNSVYQTGYAPSAVLRVIQHVDMEEKF